MINVYVGSHARYAAHEPVLKYSIEKNTTKPVNVHFMRAADMGLPEEGCTGFSKLRFHIPKIATGYAIYLDVDMLVTGDIAKLYDYRWPGKWACLVDGSTEVMVIDTSRPSPAYVRNIPMEWNSEDRITDGMQLLHFTDLTCQPWFGEHPDREAVALLDKWTAAAYA